MILITFISLIGLLIIHELGHFVLAKKFGVRVEEFGIGYPPKIFAKRFGQTLYSLNLLPVGAFIRFPDEGEPLSEDKYSRQPIFKRLLIAIGGVVSFWVISVILLAIVFTLGTRLTVNDDADGNLYEPLVQIAAVSQGSPADGAGLRPGDGIASLKSKIQNSKSKFKVEKVKQVQEFTEAHKGEEVILTIQRGKEIFDVSLVPRPMSPAGQGPMGVALIRTVFKQYPWYSAIYRGFSTTIGLTVEIIKGYYQALKNVANGAPLGVEPIGPVGIFYVVDQARQLGTNYFLQFIAIISIYLAIFNALPLPIADGGKVMFLLIEKIRKKPLNPVLESRIDAVFFTLLIMLMVLVTIKDIKRMF